MVAPQELEGWISAEVYCAVRRLRVVRLPRRQPGRRPLRSALRRRRQRRRFHSHPRLKNTFRLSPGFGVVAKTALDNLRRHQRSGGKPAKTVIIVQRGFAVRLWPRKAPECATAGEKASRSLRRSRTQHRCAISPMLCSRSRRKIPTSSSRPTTTICAACRTMQERRVQPKGIYRVLGGTTSSYTNASRTSPRPPNTSWTPITGSIRESAKAQELKKKVEDKGQFFTYELYLNYSAVLLAVADALRRAASPDRAKIIAALEDSTFSSPIMPYGPTKFVNGQNRGGTGQHASARQRHQPSCTPIRHREGSIPDASVAGFVTSLRAQT